MSKRKWLSMITPSEKRSFHLTQRMESTQRNGRHGCNATGVHFAFIAFIAFVTYFLAYVVCVALSGNSARDISDLRCFGFIDKFTRHFEPRFRGS